MILLANDLDYSSSTCCLRLTSFSPHTLYLIKPLLALRYLAAASLQTGTAGSRVVSLYSLLGELLVRVSLLDARSLGEP